MNEDETREFLSNTARLPKNRKQRRCIRCNGRLWSDANLKHDICGNCLPIDGLPPWWEDLTGIAIADGARISEIYRPISAEDS